MASPVHDDQFGSGEATAPMPIEQIALRVAAAFRRLIDPFPSDLLRWSPNGREQDHERERAEGDHAGDPQKNDEDDTTPRLRSEVRAAT